MEAARCLRFSEEAGEDAGDHFTPREVIRLMVELLDIPIPDKHLPIYDPIRVPFRSVPLRDKDDADADDAAEDGEDDEEAIAKIIREHDGNQLFVAFTATPAQATVDLFGEAFDIRSQRPHHH